MPEFTYVSFMIRLWRETAVETTGQEEPPLMGELESIQTGHAWQFQGLEPLLTLLAARLPAAPPQPDEVDNNTP